MKSILSVLSTAILGVTLSVALAMSQSYPNWQDSVPSNQLANFNNYLTQHPAVAAFLNTDPTAAGYNSYLRANPGFGQFLAANPNLGSYLGQNPGWFAERQQAYFSKYGFGPNETVLLDGFLNAHPQIAGPLAQNPRLANDQRFLAAHPNLAKFLKQYPDIASRLRENPWMWSPKQRYTQKNWWLHQDREETRVEYAEHEDHGKHKGSDKHHKEDAEGAGGNDPGRDQD